SRILRAGRGDHEEGLQIRRAIGGNCLRQCVDAQTKIAIDRQCANAVWHYSRELRRLDYRMMDLLRHISSSPPNVRAQMTFACADNRVEICHRTTGREKPACFLRKTHPIAAPVEDVFF